MKAYFSRAYAFSASHRLLTEALSEDENRAAFGKCNNPHGHGHNYRLEVTVAGPIDRSTGMVIDMVQLDSIVGREVVDRFDHMNLNLDPLFAKQVSTTENLSIALFNLLQTALKPAILEKIRIEETENNFFEYSAASEEATQA